MAQPQHQPLTFETFEDFLVWERSQTTRHELIDGVPAAMAGANEGHNIIQGNIFAALLSRLRGGPCCPFPSDMAMKTGSRKGQYPDVTVDYGPRNPENRSLPKPTVVFDVLSPKTQGEDRTVKLWEYNKLPTIAHYVLVEQSEPLVYVYGRGTGGDFMLRPGKTRGLDGTVELPAIGVSLLMAGIYDGLDFNVELDADASLPTSSPWSR